MGVHHWFLGGAKSQTTIGDEVSTPFGLMIRAAGFLVSVRIGGLIGLGFLLGSLIP